MIVGVSKSLTGSGRYRTYDETVHCLPPGSDVGVTAFVTQPGETMEDHWYTATRYGVDATRLATGLGEEEEPLKDSDRMHMNRNFGKIYLASLLEALSTHEALL